MARKDWRASPGNDSKESSWFRRDNNRHGVRFWKIGLSAPERKKRGIGVYGITATENGARVFKRYTKSSSKARKIAMSYMKRN